MFYNNTIKMSTNEKNINIKELIESKERIGVIGSPSITTKLTLDVSGEATDKRLVGSFCGFVFSQEGTNQCALGQITEVKLKNPWLEDSTIKGLIRRKGRVDPLTERHDTHTAEMIISAVFAEKNNEIKQSSLATVPSTGTSIHLLAEEEDNDVFDYLLKQYKEELFYLGYVYESKLLLPMWFRHFGKNEDGEKRGVGEAYHIGIFGKTGSGKSVLAKMAMLGYARNPEMSIFIIDPQGEFSKDIKKKDDVLELKDKLGDLNKDVKPYSAFDLVLSGWNVFKKVLMESEFLYRLGIIDSSNRSRAADVIISGLKGEVKKDKSSDQLSLTNTKNTTSKNNYIPEFKANKRDSFERIWDLLNYEKEDKTGKIQYPILSKIYSGKDYQERIKSAVEYGDKDEFYKYWLGITKLFTKEDRWNAIYIDSLIDKVVGQYTIRISDERNKKAKNTEVQILQNNNTIKTLKTDTNGECVFKPEKSGKYDVKTKEGYTVKVNHKKQNYFNVKDINQKPVIIIDLSKEELPEDIFWNETIQSIVIKELLSQLTISAEKKYKNNEYLNTLVIFDEAHRFVPREKFEDNEEKEEVKKYLTDAIKTTRKYGLGWMFISQTLSSLHKDIINQLRVYIFGFGLAWGTELQSLKEIIGGNKLAIDLYQTFKDPQTSDIGSYPFMTVGPVSPLSFSSTPLFLTAFNIKEDNGKDTFNRNFKNND